jgi:hypothetical protein
LLEMLLKYTLLLKRCITQLVLKSLLVLQEDVSGPETCEFVHRPERQVRVIFLMWHVVIVGRDHWH